MSVTNSLSRFSKDQCCGTAVLRVVSIADGLLLCIVSQDCEGDCEPSAYPVECIDFGALNIDDEITVYCRKGCGESIPAFMDPCPGGGGGDPNDEDCDGECWVKYQDDGNDTTCTICIVTNTCVRDGGAGPGLACSCLIPDCDVLCGGGGEDDPEPGEIVRLACAPGATPLCFDCPGD